MKRWVQIIGLLILLAAQSACRMETSAEPPVVSAAPAAQEVTAPDMGTERLQEIIDHTAIFFTDVPEATIRGKVHTLFPAPFLQDGVLYLPAAAVTAALGGSFAASEDVYYINYLGNVTTLMAEYNVMLFNTEAVIMDSTPVVKEDVLCLPLTSLGRALSMQCARSPSQQVYVLGVQEPLTETEMSFIRQNCGQEARPYAPVLTELAQTTGQSHTDLERAALARLLWQSDENGVISQLWMDDAGELHRQTYEMAHRFPAGQLFECRTEGLVSLFSGETVSSSPEELYRQQLRQATGRYMELLAAAQLLDDPIAATLLSGYRAALEGALDDATYLADQTEPYETGLYDTSSGENAWNMLVRSAQVGDFLVFSAADAGPEYGFFNHSALILEVDPDEGRLHLLHARGIEYGVGSELEMDQLTFAGFVETPYYQSYATVFLCSAGELTPAQAAQMAADADDAFRGYRFGYGGRLGLEETNCAELIVDAYAAAGVYIADDHYETRLKQVLKGDTKHLVLLPDDLLLSQETEVIAVWTR